MENSVTNNYLSIDIKNIKGIKEAHIELPVRNGIYALVGENGSGKSTILQALAQLIRPQNALFTLKKNDYSTDSNICFKGYGYEDNWIIENDRWKNCIYTNRKKNQGRYNSYENNNIKLYGMYEGSLFVGTRFSDSTIVDKKYTDGEININDDLIKADEYVIENLSYILHGDKNHYLNLMRLKNKTRREELGLKNIPYFVPSNHNGIISQYKMSSGECLLISLLHFIYNSIVRKSLPRNFPILMLLDEIELALHPSAVTRFIDLLSNLVKKYEHVSVFITTHAAEVIRKIEPLNIYKLENDNGVINYVNPCYPAYAIRDLYSPNGYDYLILCEDELAKKFIEYTIRNNNLSESKLINVCPVGGWQNVLKLHLELLQNNILGVPTNIISVLDGDIEKECNKKQEYQYIKKLFLPIPSIEKCFYKILYTNEYNKDLKKAINDTIFTVNSLDNIKSKFEENCKNVKESDNKKLYALLKNDIENRGIKEAEFITYLLPLLCDKTPTDKFTKQLKDMIGSIKIRAL